MNTTILKDPLLYPSDTCTIKEPPEKQRKLPYATKKLMNRITESSLVNQFILVYNLISKFCNKTTIYTCPDCQSAPTTNPKEYKIVGGDKIGWRFVCSNPTCSRKTYTRNTSNETVKITESLSILILELVLRGFTYRDIVEALNVSKHLVEIAVASLAKQIDKQVRNSVLGLEKLRDIKKKLLKVNGKKVIAIALDTSSSKISSSVPLVAGTVYSQAVIGFRHFAHQHIGEFLKIIAKQVSYNPKKHHLVIITDGEARFVEIIKSVFPEAIHVRQWHKESLMGLVLVHWTEDSTDYTLECNWDLFLHDFQEIQKKTATQRHRRQETSQKARETAKIVMENYGDSTVTLVIGKRTVYSKLSRSSKSTRVKLMAAAKRGHMTKKDCLDVDEYREYLETAKPSDLLFVDGFLRYFPVQSSESRSTTKSSPRPKVIVKSNITLQEASKYSKRLTEVLDVLRNVFASLFITSNWAERVFGTVKAILGVRRTSKSGFRLALCLLWAKFLPGKLHDGIKALFSGLDIMQPNKTYEPKRKQALLRKTLEDTTSSLKVYYRNRAGKFSWKLLDNINVYFDQALGYVFKAYDLEKQTIRIYKVSRVLQICEPTNDDYLGIIGLQYLTRDFNHVFVNSKGAELRSKFTASEIWIIYKAVLQLFKTQISIKESVRQLQTEGIKISAPKLQVICEFLTDKRLGNMSHKRIPIKSEQAIWQAMFETIDDPSQSEYKMIEICMQQGTPSPSTATLYRRQQYGWKKWR